MTSKAGRAAFAIKSGTVAAGMAVGNTLAYVAPQLAGAIDIVVVRQPDGSLKSSPFYVRFGKYTGLRSDPNKVKITVNDVDAEFCMHMGRTGEAYFIVDVHSGEQEPYAEALNGLMSPTSGYSSDQEQPVFMAEQTAASLKSALEETTMRNAASTSAIPSSSKLDAARHLTPGALSYPEMDRKHILRGTLDSTLSAPASLTSPCGRDPEDSASQMEAPRRPSSDGGQQRWPRRSGGPSTDSWSKVRSWKMDIPDSQQGLANGISHGVQGQGHEHWGTALPGEEPTGTSHLPHPSPPGDFTFSSRSSSSGSSLTIDDGIFTPPRLCKRQSGKPQPRSSPVRAQDSRATSPKREPQSAEFERKQDEAGLRSQPGETSTDVLAHEASNTMSSHSSKSRPPVHPWSVGNPRLLPSPLAAQPQVAVMSSTDAAMPVHSAPAAGNADGQGGTTAILPRRSLEEVMEHDRGRFGNRMELEAIDQKVHWGHETAPFAMAEAQQEVRNWQHGGPSPRVPAAKKKLAHSIDSVARREDSKPSHHSSQSSQPCQQASRPLDALHEEEQEVDASSSSGVTSSCGSSPQEGCHPQRLHSPRAANGEGELPHDQRGISNTGQKASAVGAHPAVPLCLKPPTQLATPGSATDAKTETPVVPASPFSQFNAQDCAPGVRSADPSVGSETAAKAEREQLQINEQSRSSAPEQDASDRSLQDRERRSREDGFGSAIDLGTGWHPASEDRQATRDTSDSPGLGKVGLDGHAQAAQPVSVSALVKIGGSEQGQPGETGGTAFARPLDDSAKLATLLEVGGPDVPRPGAAESPVIHPQQSGRSLQASESAASAPSSLPISIPNKRAANSSGQLSSSLPLGEGLGDRPVGGSLPAGAFGMSPTESARYLGMTSAGNSEDLPLTAYGNSSTDLAKRTADNSPPQALGQPQGFEGFELSICASRLQPGMSPQAAWLAFEEGRISRACFQEQGHAMAANPDLVCRLGTMLVPWQQATPAVLGMLAFGSRWDTLLPEGVAVQAAIPDCQSHDIKKEGEKRSSWRVWLGSWRARRDSSKGDMAADAAAAVERADAARQKTPPPPAAASLHPDRQDGAAGATELSASLDGMMNAGKRLPGKRRAFTPSSHQLDSLTLTEGQNTIEFAYGKQRLRAYLYYFKWDVRLVISDVDGTITRSDLLGHVLPRVGFDWSHPGINRFFSNIEKNGYHILFLSSRAIAQASATRDYLHSLKQDGHKLPCGPVIISPDGLFPSLYRELVLRRPHEFKIRALEDIRALFPATWNPFFCGFGNRDTDEISYLTVGVPPSKIFIINPKGELRKASSAVVTSTWNSLTRIVDLVNEIFPPYETEEPHSSTANATPQREEFSDYNYWHVAPPIIVDSDDEAFGDPNLKGFGDSEEEESEEEENGDFAESTPVGFRAWP